MTLKSSTKKSLKALMGINDNSLDTDLNGQLDATKNVSRYYIKGGTNYIIYIRRKLVLILQRPLYKASISQRLQKTTTKIMIHVRNTSALKLSKTYKGAVHFKTDVCSYIENYTKEKRKLTVSVGSDCSC